MKLLAICFGLCAAFATAHTIAERRLKDVDLSKALGVNIQHDNAILTFGAKSEIMLYRDKGGGLNVAAPKGIDFVTPSLTVDGSLNLANLKIGTPGTVVADIDHSHGPKSDGQYPHFSTSSWSAQIGTTKWKTGEGNYMVWQVRGNAVIWSGKMTMWASPNSPTWGTKNKAAGHARRASGSAPGQWKAGDIMFANEADALKAAPGTLITDIDHSHGPASDGKYPHFSTSSWSAQIGTTKWKTGEGNYMVWQMRGKSIIWSGKMTMWGNPNSPTWGTSNKAVGHARRQSGSAAGQWKEGDIMFSKSADALKAAELEFGILKVGGKMVGAALDVTGKLTAFADVEIMGSLTVGGKKIGSRRRLAELDTMLEKIMSDIDTLKEKNAALEKKNAALELRITTAGM